MKSNKLLYFLLISILIMQFVNMSNISSNLRTDKYTEGALGHIVQTIDHLTSVIYRLEDEIKNTQ